MGYRTHNRNINNSVKPSVISPSYNAPGYNKNGKMSDGKENLMNHIAKCPLNLVIWVKFLLSVLKKENGFEEYWAVIS